MGDTAMRITETIFWAHLQCQTKSYLKAAGAVGEQRAFSEWEGTLVEDFQRAFCLQLRLNYADDAYMVGCSLSQALDKQCSLVFDCTVQTHELQSSIPPVGARPFFGYGTTQSVYSSAVSPAGEAHTP